MGKCLSGKMAEQVPKSVLFVCLGNICHSLIAEAVFRKFVTDSNVSNKWAIGSTLRERGQVTSSKSCELPKKSWHWHSPQARQVVIEDVATSDYILCMDESNLRDLTRKSNQVKNNKAKVELLESCDPQRQLIIKEPTMGMSPTLRPRTSHVRCYMVFQERAG